MADARGNAAKRVASTTPGPWKTDPAWQRITKRHLRAIKFIETYCRAPKGKGHGQPMRLAPFQKRFLRAALSDGVDAAALQTPRGNGKSSFGGALATWALYDDDDTGAPQVPIVAKTITQAIRSCYGVAVSMIKAEPELARRALIYTGIAQPRVVIPSNEGEMFPIANDEETLQGLDPSLAIMDEAGFQPIGSWNALKLAAGKRDRSLILGIGTPGLDRDNAMYNLRNTIREGGDIPGFVFVEYGAPDGCDATDRRVWKAANPAIGAGFLRMSALELDLRLAPEGHFRIFRLGQWYDGVDSWLGANGRVIWDGLTSPYEFVDGAPTWVGVDIGLKHDSSAVVMIQRRPDEDGHPADRLHMLCKLWVPRVDEPVDVTGVMQYLRDLDATYDLQAVSYDPRFFDVPAKYLDDEGLPMIEVPQSLERMTMAVGGLYAAILGGTVTHDGDEAFTTQVMNAQPRFNERGFTLAKGKSRGRIDAAVAAALALDRVHRQETGKEPMVAWA